MMAMRGAKPKTAVQQKLAGNPGKRPLRKEPRVDGKTPVCPGHLDGEARKAWRFLVRVLRRMGLLASSDVAIMTLYSETWSQYVAVRLQMKQFAKQGNGMAQFVLISKEFGNPYINPLFNIESKLKTQLERYLGELGLSPVSRARVHTEGDNPAGDLLTDLMRRRAKHFGEN